MEDDEIGMFFARGYAREVSEASVLRDYPSRATGGPVPILDIVELYCARREGGGREGSGNCGGRQAQGFDVEERPSNISVARSIDEEADTGGDRRGKGKRHMRITGTRASRSVKYTGMCRHRPPPKCARS